MNRSLIATVSALTAATLTGCFSHTVDVKPVEVKPVHITLDVNLKVDKELDNYFDESKSAEPATSTPATQPKQGEVDYSREAMIQRYKARKAVIADLKALNPKPAAGFNHDVNSYVIPDVFVRTNKAGDYLVELNAMTLPRLLINRRYYGSIKSGGVDKNTGRYLKEQIGSANFLVRALHQRAVTILKVSEEIIRTQREFFEKGIEYLRPMILRDVAENIEMHESTVSRVTANKYIHTPRGIFELKYFFSTAAGTLSGDEGTSTLSIKHKIKKLIDEEKTEDILSDDRLVELLTLQGIKIARRTVAKYREAMGIPTSGQRKREKRNRL